jgi:hypothetical protein
VKRFVSHCFACDRTFQLSASSLPDVKRRLRTMTNCPAGRHLALPSLLSRIDVQGIIEKETFQVIDTKTE